MTIEEFFWPNAARRGIYGAHWTHSDPAAVVLLVHGLGEHCRRYDHVARFFHEQGIAMTGFDLPGFGRSEGRRGYAGGLTEMLDTVEQALGMVAEKYPGRPLYLYGHSMGGNLVLNFVLRRQSAVAGLIATGPWITLPQPPPALLLAFARLILKVFPHYDQHNGLKTAHLSRDPEVVRAYENDPLVHFRLSAALGLDMVAAAAWLDGYAGKMPVPTLLLHGEGDQITSPEGTRAFAQRVSGPVVFKGFPGLFHEIHNEPEKEEVLAHIHKWLKAQVSTTTSHQ